MLFFNVIEVIGKKTRKDNVLIRVNYAINAEYADPTCTNFDHLLYVQVDTTTIPVPGIDSFKSWDILINKLAYWGNKDWLIHIVQPIENGDSCLIMLINK